MISVTEAQSLLNAHLLSFPSARIPLSQAYQRVLCEPIAADRDLPPFDRVTMDGIAIAFEQFAQGRISFEIEDVAQAGKPRTVLKNHSQSIEVMTGAILPRACDTVIRYEDLEITDSIATIKAREILQGQNIHYQGRDRKRGEVLIEPGRLLRSPEIALAATVGKAEVLVSGLPRIALIASGDELVDIDETPLPYQIRRSNSYALHAACKKMGLAADMFTARDDAREIRRLLEQCLANYDIIISTGGVSMGKTDLLPAAFKEMGVREVFHKIAQRPGKPMWFGVDNVRRLSVFGLPGNPVSSFLGFYRYIRPYIQASMGALPEPDSYAVLNRDVQFKAPLTYFVQVDSKTDIQGRLVAEVLEGGGSGDHANLTDCNGFLELPADKDFFAAGESYKIFNYE